MKGYYKMPDATAAAIEPDGWLHTGDLACVDENGNYQITGRLKDMIIRGGENIYPKEIEEFYYTNPRSPTSRSSASPTSSTARRSWPASSSRRARPPPWRR